VVYNGFDDTLTGVQAAPQEALTLTYSGTLYRTQPVEPFLDTLGAVVKKHPALRLKLQFPGLAYDVEQKRRVEKALGILSPFTHITDRIPKAQVIDMMAGSDVLLMFAHAGFTGAASTKVFEYIALRKPILLYPSDDDILEDLLTTTGLGIICRNVDELGRTLEELVLKKLRGESPHVTPHDDIIARYSRTKQTQTLAHLLDDLARGHVA
jgi:glycosyltransferase involved in cell wall biosynthesis